VLRVATLKIMNASGRAVALISAVGLAAIIGAVVVTGGSDDEPVAGSPDDPAQLDESLETLPASNLTTPTTVDPNTPDLPDRGPHLPLRDIDGWLQSDVTSLEELRGQVVAVQFWTFGCRNCKNTLAHMREWYDSYQDQGFQVVGIHSPEFSYEAEVDNIVEAAEELGVTWPIALDTQKHTFHDWQEGPRGFWPRVYLLDRDGNVRYDHRGEGSYDRTQAAIEALLAEPTT